jgi:hypothetical protein
VDLDFPLRDGVAGIGTHGEVGQSLELGNVAALPHPSEKSRIAPVDPEKQISMFPEI